MSSHPAAKGLTCSFCGRTQEDVKKLVAGPGIYMCDACIFGFTNAIETDNAQKSTSQCSFCSKPGEVFAQSGEPNAPTICIECLDLCEDIFDDEGPLERICSWCDRKKKSAEMFTLHERHICQDCENAYMDLHVFTRTLITGHERFVQLQSAVETQEGGTDDMRSDLEEFRIIVSGFQKFLQLRKDVEDTVNAYCANL